MLARVQSIGDAEVGGSKVLRWVEAGRKAMAGAVVSGHALLMESELIRVGAVVRAWRLMVARSGLVVAHGRRPVT